MTDDAVTSCWHEAGHALACIPDHVHCSAGPLSHLHSLLNAVNLLTIHVMRRSYSSKTSATWASSRPWMRLTSFSEQALMRTGMGRYP